MQIASPFNQNMSDGGLILLGHFIKKKRKLNLDLLKLFASSTGILHILLFLQTSKNLLSSPSLSSGSLRGDLELFLWRNLFDDVISWCCGVKSDWLILRAIRKTNAIWFSSHFRGSYGDSSRWEEHDQITRSRAACCGSFHRPETQAENRERMGSQKDRQRIDKSSFFYILSIL